MNFFFKCLLLFLNVAFFYRNYLVLLKAINRSFKKLNDSGIVCLTQNIITYHKICFCIEKNIFLKLKITPNRQNIF
jgi:hypothetical protein